MLLAKRLNAAYSGGRRIGRISDLQVGQAYEIKRIEMIPPKQEGRPPALVAHIDFTAAGIPYPYPARVYLPRKLLSTLTQEDMEEYNENPHIHQISVIYQGFHNGRHEILFL